MFKVTCVSSSPGCRHYADSPLNYIILSFYLIPYLARIARIGFSMDLLQR